MILCNKPAKKILRNLLPQDTRSVEYPAAAGMILISFLLFFNLFSKEIHVNISPIWFWCLITFIVGLAQFLSLIFFPNFEVYRHILSWMSGTFFLWLAFSQPLSILSIPTFFLGISNIAAFLINTVILSEQWKQSYSKHSRF